MELMCKACQGPFEVPPERIPQEIPFCLTCPRCQDKVPLGTKVSEPRSDAGQHRGFGNTQKPGIVELERSNYEIPRLPANKFSSEPPNALICIDQSDGCYSYQDIIEGLGFLTDTPLTSDQALQLLSLNQYSLLLMDEQFVKTSFNPIADYLTGLTMNIRRNMMVILVGERFKTDDPFEAFSESVDLVVHPADVEQLAQKITRATNDHRHSYRVFNECLTVAGKKPL